MATSRAVQRIVQRVQVEARQALIAQLRAADEATLRAWQPILARLNRQLAKARSNDVDRIVAAAMREMTGAALARNVAAISRAVAGGAQAAAAQHQRLTGPDGPMYAPGATDIDVRITADRRQRIVDAAVNGSYTRDRIPLSTRMYRAADEVARNASDVVRSSIAAREGVFRGAERFIEANREQMLIPVPRYAEELADAARVALDTGDRRGLEEAIARHAAQMERLGQGRAGAEGLSTLRSAVRQFVHDLRRATPQNIERIIARHVEDRAQYVARRIVRTETAEAHRQAFRAAADESPYTVGYRWTLSSAHPAPDVCDCLANQNLHGLGPGGYPKEQVPPTPHPHCLCMQVAIVDEHYFRRQLAQRTGGEAPPTPWVDENRETAAEWLARQPEAFQVRLLGPTRAAILRDPDNGRPVVDASGTPIPVRLVLAMPRMPSPSPSARRPAVPPSAPTVDIPPTRIRSDGQVRLLDTLPAALAELRDAVAQPEATRGRAVREASRRLFQTLEPTARSWALRTGKPNADDLELEKLHHERLISGAYNLRSGLISFDPIAFRNAQQALRLALEGQPLNREQTDGLKTILHETAHEHSPAVRDALLSPGTNIRLQGLVVEEVTTELLARDGMRRLGLYSAEDVVTGGGLRYLTPTKATFPAYQRHIEAVLRAVRRHVPGAGSWPQERIADHVVAGARALRDRSETITSSAAYLQAFADALGVPDGSFSDFRTDVGSM